MEEGLSALSFLADQKMFGVIGAAVVWLIQRPHINDLKDEIKWLREHFKP